jgi:hypothetical protein
LANRQAESYRQKLVEETGRKLEDNVRRILNQILNKKDIEAFSVSQIRRWAKKVGGGYKKLFDYIQVPVKNSCTQEQVMTLPDTDILVVYKQENKVTDTVSFHPLCIVSCKASFHARETETLFWSALTQPTKIKFVLATEDSDRYNDVEERRKTELGTCKDGNKTRRLLECFLDRVYILKKYDKVTDGIVKDIDTFYHVFEKAEAQGYRGINSGTFDDYDRKPHAEYCNMVRPFDDLLFDIMKWKFEKLG